MTATLGSFPVFRALDANGAPLVGGLMYSFSAGTLTPLATYVDAAGVTTNANPVVLDSTGSANVWFGSSAYKLVLKTSTGSTLWTVDNYQPDAGSIQLRSDLASTASVSVGDALVGFKQSNTAGVLTGAVASTVHQKLQEVVSVKDFGAVGDGSNNDTSAIQKALDGTGSKTIFFPAGLYKVTGSGAACLTMTKRKNLVGEGSATVIRADGAGAFTDILRVQITDTTEGGDVRHLFIRDMLMFHNAGGANGISFHCTGGAGGLNMFETLLDNLNIASGKTSVGADPGYGHAVEAYSGWAFTTISNCTLENGVGYSAVADGNRIINNMIGGQRGLELDIQGGSFQTIISGNAIVSIDGGVVITNGSQVKILNNQFEQPQSASAVNPYKSFIWVKGLDYVSNSIDIIGNNFGGGTNINFSIALTNCTDTKISQNRFYQAFLGDVVLTVGADYNYLYNDNYFEHTVPNVGRWQFQGQDLGVGNFGLPKLSGGASVGGYGEMVFVKDPYTEEVILGAVSGGSTAATTVIVSLPIGYRPDATYYLPASSSAGPFTVKAVTGGDVTVGTTAPGATSAAGQVRIPTKRGA